MTKPVLLIGILTCVSGVLWRSLGVRHQEKHLRSVSFPSYAVKEERQWEDVTDTDGLPR